MKSFRVLGHQAKYIGAAFVMLVATFTPLLVTTTASAAQLTARSVEVSNSSVSATGVTYSFSFTATGTAGGVVVQFCSNTPLMLEACTNPNTTPGGFTAASAVGGGGATVFGTNTTNKVQLTKSITAGTNTFTLTGITNPSAAGPLYARIVTYDTDANTANYTTTAFGSGKEDDGSVAISITDTIGVSGSVLETLTYCVSGAAITDACATLSPTNLELGETVGTVKALSPSAISTGDIFTQISTNAVGGAVVRLKTDKTCGGLARVGASVCDIAPAQTGWASNQQGQAKFGVLVDATVADLGTNTGDFEASGSYNDTTYTLNFDDNDVTGVTSPYGDPILNTNSAPATGKNVKLTFGASVAPSTPAGRYSAGLSLVATGTF